MRGVKGTVFQAGGPACAKAAETRKSFSVFKEQKVCKYLWATASMGCKKGSDFAEFCRPVRSSGFILSFLH